MNNPSSAQSLSREAELVQQGWTKRFFASGSRLRETAELYKSIGLEVHLEPTRPQDLACPECQPPQPSATVEGWYVIYTRPKEGAGAGRGRDEDLW